MHKSSYKPKHLTSQPRTNPALPQLPLSRTRRQVWRHSPSSRLFPFPGPFLKAGHVLPPRDPASREGPRSPPTRNRLLRADCDPLAVRARLLHNRQKMFLPSKNPHGALYRVHGTPEPISRQLQLFLCFHIP